MSNLAIFVFACPRNPSRIILCLERMAVCNSGITVSSYPTIPSKGFVPSSKNEIKLSLISSLIDFGEYPFFFNSPKVFIEL
ncbi:hypothetical protein BMS3Abin03_00066 [bacterium BMS3Abin03]|nr:hypothetical protein BMS3Abin03_00066 [bacterium BMS3Abin03]